MEYLLKNTLITLQILHLFWIKNSIPVCMCASLYLACFIKHISVSAKAHMNEFHIIFDRDIW